MRTWMQLAAVERGADRADASVHHVGGGHDVDSGFRVA
jgi:hypothetical protein